MPLSLPLFWSLPSPVGESHRRRAASRKCFKGNLAAGPRLLRSNSQWVTGPGEKLGLGALTPKASPDPMGKSRAGRPSEASHTEARGPAFYPHVNQSLNARSLGGRAVAVSRPLCSAESSSWGEARLWGRKNLGGGLECPLHQFDAQSKEAVRTSWWMESTGQNPNTASLSGKSMQS